jgi:hypothetical protein
MKPSIFLKLALPLGQPHSAELEKYIADGGAIGSPFLEIKIPPEWDDGDFSKFAQVASHEGRNRITAVKKLEGDEPIEVHLIPRGGLRARDLTAEFVEKMQEGMYAEKSTHLVSGPLFVSGSTSSVNEAEDATVTRIDSKPITDFASDLKAYKHTDDWRQSGLDTGDDSYWKNKNLKTNTTKGLFAGDPKRTALYATGNAHETRYVEFTQDGQPIVYFDKKDLPKMRSRKTYLTVFDASDFKKLPTGEYFSEHPGKPIKQTVINDPFQYIADQGWIVRVTDDLPKIFKQVQKMHKAGKIPYYGAEGMNESNQGVAENDIDEMAEGSDNKENPDDQVRNKLNVWMEQDQQFKDPTRREGFQAKVWPYIQKNIRTILADKGKKGNGDYPAAPYAAWLLVQHMDSYPQNQIEFYNKLKQAIPDHPKIQFLKDRAAVNQWIMKNANNPKYFIKGKALPNPTVNVRNPAIFKDAGIVATSREEALANAKQAGNKLLVAAVRATKAQTQPSYKQSVAKNDIDEMALSTYKTFGDFTKPGPFQGPDKKLVPHPKNIEKATKFFEQTPYDFRLFFSNMPGTGKYSEHGPMTADEIKKVFGPQADAILQGSEDQITVVFVGNKGDRKVMLTPWMMAHRFGHAIQAGNRGNRGWSAWGEAEKHFFTTINSTLGEYYGKVDRGPGSSYMGRPKSEQMNNNLTPEYNALFNAIGTQRSSRSGEIRRPYEFLYELFAQYLGTGKVTLNPLPSNLGYGRKAWGTPSKYMNIKPEFRDESERAHASEMLAGDMQMMFDDVLSSSVGKIFVM